MSATTPLEAQLLAPAQDALANVEGRDSAAHSRRLQVLECVSAQCGGWQMQDLLDLYPAERPLEVSRCRDAASRVLRVIHSSPIPVPLALASLARPRLSVSDQRKTGAYYTDWRLARYLAAELALSPDSRVLDPASGTGILLAAAVDAACGDDPQARTKMIADSVFAADLDESALRGVLISLAAMTDDVAALERLGGHLRGGDSLVLGPDMWDDVGSMDACVLNPPWEMLRVTRHELALSRGHDRHYGAAYRLDAADVEHLARARSSTKSYIEELQRTYELQGRGETDLYRVFTELAFKLVHDAGQVGILIPAGLIRSQGTEDLRRFIMDAASALDITVLENRARFFAIDTRFKFVAMRAVVDKAGHRPRQALKLMHARGDDTGVRVDGRATIGRKTLGAVRADLTLPEVRSSAEWRIFRQAASAGRRLGDKGFAWHPEVVREVDMTLHRRYFFAGEAEDALPVVEGRMVAQHRFGHKRHVGGTGRRATWEIAPPGPIDDLGAQFSIPIERVPPRALERTGHPRVGFCDITGQTNERSLLAGLIPAGVVCGNKVPTVMLPNADGTDAQLTLLAVFNSTPFDWLLRRIITTTVNFFLLRSMPFPDLDPRGEAAEKLARLAEQADLTAPNVDLWKAAHARAEIDARVAASYGLTLEDLELMAEDFPLLDRSQPALPGEARSTVTVDLMLLHGAQILAGPDHPRTVSLRGRVKEARARGAVAYLPSEAAGIYRRIDRGNGERSSGTR